MKTSLIIRLSTVLVFLFLAPLAQAQTAPAALAQPGYWNVETNTAHRDYSTVRFYNAQDQLVYQEQLPGLCLDLSRRTHRRRTTRQLNAALQQVLRDPSTAQSPNLLAQQLGHGHHLPRTYAAR